MANTVNMVKQTISNVKDMKYSIDIKNAYSERENIKQRVCYYAKVSKSQILISTSFL